MSLSLLQQPGQGLSHSPESSMVPGTWEELVETG